MDFGTSLARNARRDPNRFALICDNREYTYGTLNDAVNRLANGLVRLGIKKGDKVALMMQNSDYYVIAFAAAAKTGAVLVPMNFRLTTSEVAYILNHSDSVLVICDAAYGDLIAQARLQCPNLHHVVELCDSPQSNHYTWAEVESASTAEPEVKLNERDDFEILFTSGTTGRPKGALFDYHRIFQVGVGISAILRLHPTDRLLHVAPLYHSAQLNLFLLPGLFLTCGHVIHTQFDPVRVLSDIELYKISMFFGVPTMYSYLLQVPQSFELSSVTRCGYGAAPMAPELVKRSQRLFETDDFFNLCGLTEAGPGGMYLAPADHAAKLGAGGKAMLQTETRVVNPDDEDVPPGIVGELLLQGETIMKEYYKNPEATAETMRGGWLHTGDLAVVDEGGFITLVDRAKDMIISGGENVYSVEVEQVVYAHPDVLEAAVIGVPDEVWGETVTCLVVAKPGTNPTAEHIQQFCRKNLAGYKAPRVVRFVEALPRNASGKVLKYQLRQAYDSHSKRLGQHRGEGLI